jgi:hypothetical protein
MVENEFLLYLWRWLDAIQKPCDKICILAF